MTDVRIVDDQANRWATELTLERLLNSSEYTNDVLLKVAKKILKEDANQIAERRKTHDDEKTKQLSARIKETGDKSDLETRFAAKRYENAVANLRDSLVSTLGDLGSSLNSADPGSIFRSISGNLDSVGRQFGDVSTTLTRVIGVFAVAAKIISISYDRISQLNDGYVQAYSAGVKFADGLSGLNQMVGESGMTMQDYLAIMNKSSQSFNVLGSLRVRNLSNEFRSLTANGSNLTMTLAQSQEGLMAYADIVRMSGRLQRMSDKDIAQGAASYLKSINDLSYASGRSREELLASTKDALSRPEFQAFMSTLSDGAKANLETSITSLAAFGSDIQSKMASFLEAGMVGGEAAMFKNNEALFRLAQQTGQLPQMMRIVQMAQAGQDVSGAMLDFTEGMKNSTFVQSQNFAILAQHNPLYKSMYEEYGRLIQETGNVAQAQEQLAKDAKAAGFGNDLEGYKKSMSEQADAMLAAQSEMQTAMTLMNSAFNQLILDVIYPVLIPGLRYLAEGINTIVKTLSEWRTGLSDFFGGGSGGDAAASGVMLGAGAIGAGILGYGAYKGYKGVRGLMGGGASPLPDVLQGAELPDMGRQSRLGRMLTGLGDGVGSIGRGTGSGIQGTLTGIAEGFKAFANPRVAAGMLVISGGIAATGFAFKQFAGVEWDDMAKAGVAIGALALPIMLASNVISKVPPTVVLGAGYIGAAIAAIGAGIAGAAWMLGGTLPTLAEGVKSFADIDGNALNQVGLGMASLSAGIILMAGSGLADAVASFGEMIVNLFTIGEEDPIDRLKRFGELGEPLGKAGPALDAFGTAFLNATAKMNASILDDSVTTSMDQIMAILKMDASGVFGGEPPIIGQINSLADAMARINQESNNMSGTVAPSTSAESPDMLSPSDLQKRTLAFYENQRTSNASIIALLQAANEKLETINSSVVDDTNRTVSAIKKNSPNM